MSSVIIQQTCILITNQFLDLETKITNLEQQNNDLTLELEKKNKEIDDLKNLNKKSIYQSMDKQINESKKYIKILESQIEKNKIKTIVSDKEIKTIVSEEKESKTIASEEKEIKTIASEEKEIKTIASDKEEIKIIASDKEEIKIIASDKEEIKIIASDKEEKETIAFEENISKTTSKKKKKEAIDLDLFEEINGFELLEYKKTPGKEEIKMIPKELEKESKLQSKKKKKDKETFDLDLFEEINGYELLEYKKIYYLKDLETNELYDIVNFKPNKVIGILSMNGKVKLN